MTNTEYNLFRLKKKITVNGKKLDVSDTSKKIKLEKSSLFF